MTTVYAAFDSRQAVAAAVDQLMSCGFLRSSIRYAAHDRFRDPPLFLRQDPGFLSSVESFLTKLVSSSTAMPTGLYEKSLRRGGTVLAVDASTAVEEQTARVLLRNAGSIETDTAAKTENEPSVTPVVDTSDIDATDRPVAIGGLPLYKCLAENSAQLGPAASEADLRSFQSGSYEVRGRVEAITLTKVTRVVEELSVHKSVTVYSETVTDTQRATFVDEERIPPPLRSGGPPDSSS